MSNEVHNAPASSISVHIPVALLALTIAIFLFTQKSATSAQSDYMRWQINNLDKQQTQLVELDKQLQAAYAQREPNVKASTELQERFQKFLSDLLELAKEDKDAQKIVEDWKIQKPNPPAAAPAAPAPAPDAAKKP